MRRNGLCWAAPVDGAVRDRVVRRRVLVRRRRRSPTIWLQCTADARHPIALQLLHLPLQTVPVEKRTYPVSRRRALVRVQATSQCEDDEQPRRTCKDLEHDRDHWLAVRRGTCGHRSAWRNGVGVTPSRVRMRHRRVEGSSGRMRDDKGV